MMMVMILSLSCKAGSLLSVRLQGPCSLLYKCNLYFCFVGLMSRLLIVEAVNNYSKVQCTYYSEWPLAALALFRSSLLISSEKGLN